jgi:hypothetical protein
MMVYKLSNIGLVKGLILARGFFQFERCVNCSLSTDAKLAWLDAW